MTRKQFEEELKNFMTIRYNAKCSLLVSILILIAEGLMLAIGIKYNIYILIIISTLLTFFQGKRIIHNVLFLYNTKKLLKSIGK